MIEVRYDGVRGKAQIWVDGKLCLELSKQWHDLDTADDVTMAIAGALNIEYSFKHVKLT
jgi:hypothetical protein